MGNYCKSGNIGEVLIFANSARMANSRIQNSRKNYYYNSATKEKWKFRILNFVKVPKSEIRKYLNTKNYQIYSMHMLLNPIT